MPLPALVTSSSTEYLPLSADENLKYHQELERYTLSFRLRPDIPFYSRQIGRLLSVLKAHEVACQFFEFASIIETGPAINAYTVDFFRSMLISFDHDKYTQEEIIGSFIVISEPSPQEVLLLRMMDSMEIPPSRRDEFRSEFQMLSQRYRPQKQVLPQATAKTAKPKGKREKRAPVDWRSIQLPEGLRWPSQSYSAAAKIGISIISHLETEWKDLIAAGIATRKVVEAVDPTTLTGIENYRYVRSGKRPERADRTIPDDLLPLTKKQALDRAIMNDPTLVLTSSRVVGTLASRVARANRRKKTDPILLTAKPG